MKQDSLTHWGIRGQKWGVRRYQNPDGTRTPAGKKRYSNKTPGQKVATSMAVGALAGATTQAAMESLTGFKSGKKAAKRILSGALGGAAISAISAHVQSTTNTGIFKENATRG